ncbi:MAG: outer membrane lipoprotein chaperone LolA [Neisseriaceae bacterium]
MKRSTVYIVSVMLALIASMESFADGLSQLKTFNKTVTDLSGEFTQIVKSNKGSKSTSGHFAISRPSFFRWRYDQPYQQIIVADGKTIWVYDIDLKQVVKRRQAQALGTSPAAILASQEALEQVYTLSNAGDREGIEYVLAKPKQANSGYQYIKIGFREGKLARMELKDGLGNQSFIELKNLKYGFIERNQYQFKPPKGIDVLQE